MCGTIRASLLQPGWCCPIWLFFPPHISYFIKEIINKVTQEWWGFLWTQHYHSKGRSWCSAWCPCSPSLLELKDGSCSESAVHNQAPDRMQHAWLSGKWKGYRLFCQLDLVLIMFKYLKVTKLQSAEIWHKGPSLRLSQFDEVRQQKRINWTEQNQQPLLRCYSSH